MADNLLDKASILLTPTAYDNGSMLSVKPENGDGDFDFERNSAATRVNAQGLVENVQIISSELVSNGDFSQEGSELITNGDFATDSDWNGTNTNGVTISNGSLNYSDTTLNHNVSQGSVVTIGKSYKVTLTVSNYVKGSVLIIVGAGGSLQEVSSNGTFTMYGVASINTTFYFQARGASGTTLTIDNVSVKEVGQNWENTFGSQWTFDGSRANLEAGGAGYLKYISGVTEVGKKYRISYVTSGVSPTNRILFYGINNYNINATTEGVTEGVFIADGTYIRFRGQNATADISIESVSVKEITDDTDLPRIDYTDGCGNWLLEPQSTNLINNSELLNTYFSYKIDTTITDNYGTSPSGETNSSRIQFVDDTSFCYNVISVSTDHTSSVFVKGVSGETVRFGIGSSVLTGDLFTFNGLWQRIDFTASSATQIFFSSYGGATTRDFEAFGLQLEALSFVTSYIPTNGATSTRLQDIATNSGNASLINSTEGVLYAEIAALADDTTNNRISLSYNNQNYVRIVINNLQINFSVFNNGAYQVNMNYTVSNITDFNKIAVKYKENDFALWINGTEVLTDTSGLTSFASPLDHINFSNANGNNQFFYGKTKALAVYKEALTDAELQSLTTQ